MTTRENRNETAASAPQDALTRQELCPVDAQQERLRKAKAGPKLKKARTDGTTHFLLAGEGEEKARNAQLFMENFATADSDAATYFLWELTRLFEADGSQASEWRMQSALAMIRGMDPQNELETMLALQILAIHEATMTHARRFKKAETLAQMEYAERTLHRLARTQVMQIEALRKLRGTGEQKVTVRHVHVHDGGQAVVGNVTGGGRP